VIIHSRKCRQCGVIIPEQHSDLRIRQNGFVISQISAICKNGHLQPISFED